MIRIAHLLKQYRKSINPPYGNKDLLVLFATLLILFSIPLTAIAVLQGRQPTSQAAGTAVLYLTPASQSINQGGSFSIQIRENSNAEFVNAVQANLTYDATKLNFVSIDTTGSAFDLQFENTGGAGAVNIARAATIAKSGDQLIAIVNFQTRLTPGATAVTFAAGSAIVRSSDATDILGTTTGGTYTIVNPIPAVTITSPLNNQIVSGNVTVSANSSDDQGVAKVEFYVDGVLRNTDTTSPYGFTLDSTTVTNASHTLMARAYDTQNSMATSSISITVDNQPPSAPTGLTAVPISGNQINLSWTASTDNIGVTGYDVYRNNVKVATVAVVSYNDTGLSSATTYSYFIKAKDAQGNISAASNTVSATTLRKGDLNQDGKVDIFDASILAAKWGTSDPVADLNLNGKVDIFDASILAANWSG